MSLCQFARVSECLHVRVRLFLSVCVRVRMPACLRVCVHAPQEQFLAFIFLVMAFVFWKMIKILLPRRTNRCARTHFSLP